MINLLLHVKLGLVSHPITSPGKKQCGELRQISWAYSQKVVRTNEIVRSVKCCVAVP